MNRNALLAILALVLLSSCDGFILRRQPPVENMKKVWGYKPVFSNDSSLYEIKSDTARRMISAGKIYVKDNLIFQNDIGTGVHVIDRTDPSNLVRLGFIRIAGNTEISIKGNFLFANSFDDLVVVDVSNWNNVRPVKRVKHAYNNSGLYRPWFNPAIPIPERGVYYECSGNYSNMIHTGWVRDSVYNMCYNP